MHLLPGVGTLKSLNLSLFAMGSTLNLGLEVPFTNHNSKQMQYFLSYLQMLSLVHCR